MKRLRISLILMIAAAAVTGTAFADPQRIGTLTESAGTPSRVAVDAQGSVYVSDSSDNIVRKFSSNGALLGAISVRHPLGVAVSPAGLIYVCSTQFSGKQDKNSVYVFAPDFTKVGSLGAGEGEFGTPVDVDLDANGMVYVIDTFHHLVKVYNPQGVKTASFGGYDAAVNGTPGKLRKPIGMAINDAAGEIYVADQPFVSTVDGLPANSGTEGIRLSVFQKDGTFKRSFGQYGMGAGYITSPVEIALDKAGLLYVSDNLQHVVHLLNPADGTPVGAGGLYDLVNPGFRPSGVAISRNNLAYVGYQMYNGKHGRVDVYALDGYVTMNVSPAALAFLGQQYGGNPAPQDITIANSGSGTLNWTASATMTSPEKNWLVLDRTSGTAGPASANALTVSVNMAALGVGTHTGTITIASDFGEQRTVNVTMIVTPPPFLAVDPGSLTFTAKKGRTAPSQNATITISDPVGAMAWTATSDSSWLSIAPASGTATAAAPSTTAAVSVNTGGLNFGTYSGVITVSAPGTIGSGRIEVTLKITSTRITVETSLSDATFTVSGPATYTGSGPTWSVDDAAPGAYTVTYGDVADYKKPASETKALVADGDVQFTRKYIYLKKNIIVAKGPGEKNDAAIKAYKSSSKSTPFDLVAFEGRYGAYVAAGDIDGDGAAELVVGAGNGPNHAAKVRVFRADKTLVLEFTPLSSLDGARVAVADLNGDGQAEVIAAPAGGTDSTVVVYSYDKGSKRMVPTGISFTACDATSTNGVNIAAADIDGSGRPQIITAPGFGKQNPGVVRAWKTDTTGGMGSWTATKENEISLSAAYGATVAAGDVDGDGRDEIIAGTAGSGSSVTIIKADGSQGSFKAFDNYGVNVAAADLNADGAAEIIAAQGPSLGEHSYSGGTAEDKLNRKKDSKENEAGHSDADQERGSVRVSGASGEVIYTIIPFGTREGGINVAAGDLGL